MTRHLPDRYGLPRWNGLERLSLLNWPSVRSDLRLSPRNHRVRNRSGLTGHRLARLALLAQRRGEIGVLRHLACFFKSPLGVEEHDFFKQFALLEDYVQAAGRGNLG